MAHSSQIRKISVPGRDRAQSHFAARPVSWTLLFLWTSAIYFVSAMPARSLPSLPQGIIPWDKVIHAGEWAMWGALASLALSFQFPGFAPQTRFILAVSGGAFFGLVDEIHQYFVPGRACDPWDWLADGMGAALGALFLLWAVQRLALRASKARKASRKSL